MIIHHARLLLSLVLLPLATAVSAPVVKTLHGTYRGTTSEYVNGVNVFKGIRYADSTAGENRWTHTPGPSNFTGIANATSFGPECPQRAYDPSGGEGAVEGDEDCLFLNIWTPDGFTNTSNLPVFFWIYGGRFEGGAGSETTYDGSGLAKRGVVVVTINYRLGALGWLAHPELSQETGYNASGNWGLMDQQAALHWTAENIQLFGGNASQITVGGRSAGSASALDMAYSPQASGLFQGVISESGARAPHDPETGSVATSHLILARAEAEGVSYLSSLNISSISEARNVSLSTILGTGFQDDTTYANTSFNNNEAYPDPPLFRPVIDGYYLPYSYDQSLALNNHTDVPILTGNNKDETGASPDPDVDLVTYTANNTAIFKPLGLADRFFRLFPASNNAESNNQTNNLYRNQSLISTWMWANAWKAGGAKSSVYTYYWTHAPPGQSQGAFHGSEINYIMNNLPYGTTLFGETLNWTRRDYDIAEKMSSYWINFMRSGNPNGENLTHWEPSSNASKNTMLLGDGWGTIPVGSDDMIQFMGDYFDQEPAY